MFDYNIIYDDDFNVLFNKEVHWWRIDHDAKDDQFLWDMVRVCKCEHFNGSIQASTLYDMWCYVNELENLSWHGGAITVDMYNRLMNILNYLTMSLIEYDKLINK